MYPFVFTCGSPVSSLALPTKESMAQHVSWPEEKPFSFLLCVCIRCAAAWQRFIIHIQVEQSAFILHTDGRHLYSYVTRIRLKYKNLSCVSFLTRPWIRCSKTPQCAVNALVQAACGSGDEKHLICLNHKPPSSRPLLRTSEWFSYTCVFRNTDVILLRLRCCKLAKGTKSGWRERSSLKSESSDSCDHLSEGRKHQQYAEASFYTAWR